MLPIDGRLCRKRFASHCPYVHRTRGISDDIKQTWKQLGCNQGASDIPSVLNRTPNGILSVYRGGLFCIQMNAISGLSRGFQLAITNRCQLLKKMKRAVLHLYSIKNMLFAAPREQGVSYHRKSTPCTLCYLFSMLSQFPKLDVAGSIPVSRSIFSITSQLLTCPKIS